MACISVPVHCLAFYCILYKTPTHMNSVKTMILVLHLCCVSFDVVLTLFAIPYPMFPAMAGYGLGIVDSPGILLYLMVTIITATTTSVFVIFENRFFVLFGEHTWWRHVRKHVIWLSYMMVPIYFIPAQFYIPEQVEAREVVWESLSCQPELPAHRELFVLSTDFYIPAYSILIAYCVPGFELWSFTLLNTYLLFFAKPKSNISRKTRNLQKKLALAVMIQDNALVTFFAFPVDAVAIVIYTSYQSQLLNNLVFFGLSIHGTISTFLLILIHTPYRDFVWGPFARLWPKRAETIVVAVTVAPRNAL